MFDLVGIQQFLRHMSYETLNAIYWNAHLDSQSPFSERSNKWLMATVAQTTAVKNMLPMDFDLYQERFIK